jgi:hypothetical protein
MKLPYLDNILIEDRKLSEYLLNINHPDGKNKAMFFAANKLDKESLKNLLLLQVKENEVKEVITLEFGTKYIIESKVKSPNSSTFILRSVWIVYLNEKFVKLITAYPIN